MRGGTKRKRGNWGRKEGGEKERWRKRIGKRKLSE